MNQYLSYLYILLSYSSRLVSHWITICLYGELSYTLTFDKLIYLIQTCWSLGLECKTFAFCYSCFYTNFLQNILVANYFIEKCGVSRRTIQNLICSYSGTVSIENESQTPSEANEATDEVIETEKGRFISKAWKHFKSVKVNGSRFGFCKYYDVCIKSTRKLWDIVYVRSYS